MIMLDADRELPELPPRTEAHTHRLEIVSKRTGEGYRDYVIVCSCGWVSLPSVWEPHRPECHRDVIERETARNRRIYNQWRAGV